LNLYCASTTLVNINFFCFHFPAPESELQPARKAQHACLYTLSASSSSGQVSTGSQELMFKSFLTIVFCAFLTPGSGISFLRIRFRTVRTWKRMGWTEGVDEGWLRIRNRIGSGFNQFKCIRTRKRVVENDESWEVRWVGGWGRRRLDPN